MGPTDLLSDTLGGGGVTEDNGGLSQELARQGPVLLNWLPIRPSRELSTNAEVPEILGNWCGQCPSHQMITVCSMRTPSGASESGCGAGPCAPGPGVLQWSGEGSQPHPLLPGLTRALSQIRTPSPPPVEEAPCQLPVLPCPPHCIWSSATLPLQTPRSSKSGTRPYASDEAGARFGEGWESQGVGWNPRGGSPPRGRNVGIPGAYFRETSCTVDLLRSLPGQPGTGPAAPPAAALLPVQISQGQRR